MPFFDRCWWLRLLLSLLALPVSIGSSVALSTGILADDPGFALPMQLLGGCLTMLTAIFAAVGVASALAGRRRKRARLAALRGALDALPLARIRPDPQDAPDPSALPIELLWRARAPWEAGPGVVTPRSMLRLLGSLWLPALLSVTMTLNLITLLRFGRLSVLAWVIPLLLALASFLLAASLFISDRAGGGMWRLAAALRRRPFGVIADERGIEWRTPFGHHMVRWEEARLLEAMRDPTGRPLAMRYVLYGSRDVVRWGAGASVHFRATGAVGDLLALALRQGDEYVAPDLALAESLRRERHLLALVVAKTGLPIRTLDATYQLDSRAMARHGARLIRGLLAGAALWLASLAVGPTLSPGGAFRRADITMAVCLALAALLLAGSLVRRWVVSVRQATQALPHLAPLVAPVESPSGRYALTSRSAYTLDPWLWLAGAGASLAGVLAVLELLDRFAYPTEAAAALLILLDLTIAATGAIAVMVGLVVTWAFQSTRRTRVVADVSGITMYDAPLGGQTLAWDAVDRLFVVVSGGRPEEYNARGAAGWPRVFWYPQAVPERDPEGMPIAADEMVALVAQRAGIVPEIVDADQSPLRLGDQG